MIPPEYWISVGNGFEFFLFMAGLGTLAYLVSTGLAYCIHGFPPKGGIR